jgi:hypothetical protein
MRVQFRLVERLVEWRPESHLSYLLLPPQKSRGTQKKSIPRQVFGTS